MVLVAISSASIRLEVGQAVVSIPIKRDVDIFLGYFCGVMLVMVPGSMASKPSFRALLELMSDNQCSLINSIV